MNGLREGGLSLLTVAALYAGAYLQQRYSSVRLDSAGIGGTPPSTVIVFGATFEEYNILSSPMRRDLKEERDALVDRVAALGGFFLPLCKIDEYLTGHSIHYRWSKWLPTNP